MTRQKGIRPQVAKAQHTVSISHVGNTCKSHGHGACISISTTNFLICQHSISTSMIKPHMGNSQQISLSAESQSSKTVIKA